MTERFQVYRCNVCGDVVEVLSPGAGQLVCCGRPMELLGERTGGEGEEKHLPVAERTGGPDQGESGGPPPIPWGTSTTWRGWRS